MTKTGIHWGWLWIMNMIMPNAMAKVFTIKKITSKIYSFRDSSSLLVIDKSQPQIFIKFVFKEVPEPGASVGVDLIKYKLFTGVPEGNRTLVAAATERCSTIELQAPY